MTPDDWIRIKNAQLETCFIIRQAQVVAKWVVLEAQCTIAWASHHQKLLPKKDVK